MGLPGNDGYDDPGEGGGIYDDGDPGTLSHGDGYYTFYFYFYKCLLIKCTFLFYRGFLNVNRTYHDFYLQIFFRNKSLKIKSFNLIESQ